MYAFRNSSFTKEQLTNLGVGLPGASKDLPNQVTPLFPPLISKPIEIEKNVSLDYKIVWKEDFRSWLHETHNSIANSTTSDRFYSKVANAVEKEHKKKFQHKFAYNLMPAELKLQGKRKQTTKAPIMAKRSKKSKEFDDKKLEILEQKETNMKDPEGSEKGENDSDDGEVNVDEVEDPELDDETDYHNNYFDNGEGFFADEDDNLDDGPVY